MSLWSLAWRYLWRRPLVTVLTLLGIALGAALISGVLTLKRETNEAFRKEAALFDLVVGAKGSPLQLTLSTVYHLDMPTGNIPYSQYETLKEDNRVTKALPISLGDQYKGFRIVGTTGEFFEIQRASKDQPKESLFQFEQGDVFENPFDAVIGSQVAQQTGLTLGDTFHSSHGLVDTPGAEIHDEHDFRVVGILAPTFTANDRAIYTPLESVWQAHDHGDEHEEEGGNFLTGHSHDHEEHETEITAVLLQLRSPGMRLFLADEIRRTTDAMAAIPVNEMLRMYQKILLPMQQTLLAVAYLVVVVASLTVITTLYQSAERRRRDIALIRTLGAYRSEIFALVLIEAFLLTALGLLLGWFLGHLAVQLGSTILQEQTGLLISAWSIDWFELQALGIVGIIGIAAGLFPALLAYRYSPAEDIHAM